MLNIHLDFDGIELSLSVIVSDLKYGDEANTNGVRVQSFHLLEIVKDNCEIAF